MISPVGYADPDFNSERHLALLSSNPNPKAGQGNHPNQQHPIPDAHISDRTKASDADMFAVESQTSCIV
jgi:hypothetical protein